MAFPGVYKAYSFNTYFLKEDKAYTVALIEELSQPVRWSGDAAVAWNHTMANLIDPDSTPWKVTYRVTNLVKDNRTHARLDPDSTMYWSRSDLQPRLDRLQLSPEGKAALDAAYQGFLDGE